jgi:hypothetical protein
VSPFILLVFVEFVDVVAARLGKGEVEVLPRAIAPMHGISEKVDEIGKRVIV